MKHKMIKPAFALTAVAILLAMAPASTRAGSITAKGSDTLVILAQKWAEVYMGKHPGTKIQVTGGGSGTGFAALQNRTTDLCNASRPIKSKEVLACIKAFRKRPTEYKVALDGLSVYVNEKNPVKALNTAQLKGIFTGKITNWKQLGGKDAPIVLYSRENSSGTYEFFKKSVLEGADYAARAQTMPGTAAVLQAVGKDLNGIGYGGAAYGGGARALNISKGAGAPAVEPTEANVLNGSYPIWRYLYIYVNPALDKGEVATYLNWIRSADGQKIVKNVGYFPLPAKLQK
ncbi:MAG: phosphate ABC transporter substrate-binding protein [Verrucomicrobiia bacterium]